MLPERGGSGYFSLLVADRLADLNRELGRPVTIEELVQAISDGAGVPWSYLTQRYQQQLATKNRHREGPTTDVVGPSPGFDPALGWHYDGFDPANPEHRRRALRSAVTRRLWDASKPSARQRTWAVRHPDGTYERSAEVHPRVRSDGHSHDWTPELRAQSERESAAEIAQISQVAAVRSFELASVQERATMLRYLVAKLPVSRSEASKATRAGRLRDLDRLVGDDPERIIQLMHELTRTVMTEAVQPFGRSL